MTALKRYASPLPLPPYTYVPGQTPHPMSADEGHRLLGVQFAPTPVDLDNWRSCLAYCYAIDLFNRGYYWEAHEVWESLWHQLGRSGDVADFVKGLIKLAAALVKALEGRAAGVASHAARAAELFATVDQSCRQRGVDPSLAGLRLSHLRSLAEQLAAAAQHRVVEGQRLTPDQPQAFETIRLTPS